MARDRELSRSPSYKRRRYSRLPSPKYNNRRDRTRRDRDCSPYNYSRRRSHSLSLRHRRYRSRSPTYRRHRSRSLTSRRHKRQKSKNPSLSLKAKSPSIGSLVNKIVDEKLKKEQEVKKKRRQQEAELKLVEEETEKRVEEAIRKKVEERLGSEEIKLEIKRQQLEDGRKKVAIDIIAQLEKEKEDAIIEARQKEEQAEREKEELERLVEQNKRRIEKAQRREAMEQQRREEERYKELEELQRQKEEALLRKKQQEEEEHAKQQKLLGKNKSRPKLSFTLEFRDILIQHLESVKKSIDEKVQLKRYRTESKEQDTSSRSGNDAHDDAYIRPIYDEELMAEVQTTAEIDVFAIGQHHTDQPEFNNEGGVVQNAEECHDTYVIETINIELEHKVDKLLKENESLKKNYKELFDSIKITRAKNTEHTTSLIATNVKFKAQLQEKRFAIAAIKNELRKSTVNSMNTKFTKSSILGKPISQPFRNQSVVRQPTAFKSERPRFSKPQCDSQVDVHNDLSKPVTTHYLPMKREAVSAKPHHMIASRNSRISSENMSKFRSNDMIHHHYLEEAKKKTQERSRNSEPTLMPSASPKNTVKVSKPMPRRNTQTSRN
nr:hypothetical protein [Tanacetum cinerariifolium]